MIFPETDDNFVIPPFIIILVLNLLIFPLQILGNNFFPGAIIPLVVLLYLDIILGSIPLCICPDNIISNSWSLVIASSFNIHIGEWNMAIFNFLLSNLVINLALFFNESSKISSDSSLTTL